MRYVVLGKKVLAKLALTLLLVVPAIQLFTVDVQNADVQKTRYFTFRLRE